MMNENYTIFRLKVMKIQFVLRPHAVFCDIFHNGMQCNEFCGLGSI